ncbi:MAG: membrane protein insertion efficiency factor YidD [Nitrospirae bacterium]|nr:membrane protein insertion efficiency factor YidD [Nitrospirota bacterium]
MVDPLKVVFKQSLARPESRPSSVWPRPINERAVIGCQFLLDLLILTTSVAGLRGTRELCTQEKYWECAVELNRFILEETNPDERAEALLLLGDAYLELGEDSKARDAYEDAMEIPGHRATALRRMGDAYLRRGNHSEAIAVMDHLLTEQAVPVDDAALFKARAFLYEEEWAAASAQLALVPETHDGVRDARLALEGVQNLPRRSPALAVGLSAILPGAGQAYAGRPLDGIQTLLINGLLATGIGFAFTKGEPVAGSALIFLTVPFYGGNLYNAHRHADDYNARQARKVIEEIDSKLGFQPVPRPHSSSREPAQPTSASAGEGAIEFYQSFLSRHWGGRCAFIPSCSRYGHAAVMKYGFLRGTILIGARLLRDNPSALAYYPLTRDAEGRLRAVDPVE